MVQRYPSHSIGSLAFGADGALYVSGGDGAASTSPTGARTGTRSTRAGSTRRRRRCPEPTDCRGRRPAKPGSAHGRRPRLPRRSDPGVNPATGAGLPDNPLAASTDPNARRIVAYGVRNPFRINVRPGTNEVWVGRRRLEHLGRNQPPGEPGRCHRGQFRLAMLRGPAAVGYDGANLISARTCTEAGAVTDAYTYHHSNSVVAGETCPTGSSSVSGIV